MVRRGWCWVHACCRAVYGSAAAAAQLTVGAASAGAALFCMCFGATVPRQAARVLRLGSHRLWWVRCALCCVAWCACGWTMPASGALSLAHCHFVLPSPAANSMHASLALLGVVAVLSMCELCEFVQSSDGEPLVCLSQCVTRTNHASNLQGMQGHVNSRCRCMK